MNTTKLKAARTALKLTQVDLAFHSRVSPTDISKFENGMARPYPTQAARIAKVLNLSPSELLDPADEPQHIA
jgi:transcriptional regulator with XRE-family HTH domain